MQNQNRNQKTIIPTVQYHPSIQNPTAKPRPSQAQKTSPAVDRRPQIRGPRNGRLQTGSPQTVRPQTGSPKTVRPQTGSPKTVRPQTGSPKTGRLQTGSLQVDPGPVGGLPCDGRQRQSAQKACTKAVQGAAADVDPDRTPLRPEQVPPGVGVQVDRCVVKEVELLTRGQSSNPDWFAWRKNRITASVAHRIAHCRFSSGKSKTPPTSYLATITGEGRKVQTRAMSWGIQMEAEVIRRYQVQLNTPDVQTVLSGCHQDQHFSAKSMSPV
ncbi:cyclin-dependent kinase 8-like [Plectropomus leopardus]|uniref:cyclin-dependent kinase 8-like n=1 Tax=Plectropomus leopardus TaxID=160734 RepID=UPI001C4D999B|nr:cyclin-dependent kinase 8-like [Plectropomus leopardus]